MTNVLNQNSDFNKSHYLGVLGAVQLRKKIILFTQDVTFPSDVSEVMVTACGGGAGAGGGGAGKAYSGSTSGPGGSGGVGSKLQTALAKISGSRTVHCEIGSGGQGGAGGQQRISSWSTATVITSTNGADGIAGGDTKFSPFDPGTNLIFYGATRTGKGGSNASTTGAVGNAELISIPLLETSSGAGGNTGAAGADGGDSGDSYGGNGGSPSSPLGSPGGGGGGGGAGQWFGGHGGYIYGKLSGLTNGGGQIGFFFNGTDGLVTGSNSMNGQVWTSVRTVGSRLIVGGDFTTYQAASRNRIASVSGVSGSLDGTWSIGTGFNGSVRALATDASGNVVVGGAFTSYNGNTRNRLVRLIGTNGSFDSTLVIGTGLNNTVNAIAVQPDGKILIGGDFTSYNAQARNRIARISSTGTIDTTGGGGQFNIGTGFNGSVNVIALGVGPDAGKIYVGGAFTTYNSLANKRYILRLNSNGTEDTSFDISASPVTNGGFNGIVRAIKVDTNPLSPHYGKIYVGGDFTSYKGLTVNRIIRLNSNGSKDATFDVGNGFNGSVRAIDILYDGRIAVGGDFTEYNNIGVNSIARLNLNGTVDYLPTAVQFGSEVIVGEIYTIQADIDYGGAALARLFGSGNSGAGTVVNYINQVKGADGFDGGYGAGGGGGQGGAYFPKVSAPGGKGGNGGQGYMVLSYFSRFE